MKAVDLSLMMTTKIVRFDDLMDFFVLRITASCLLGAYFVHYSVDKGNILFLRVEGSQIL